MQLKFPVSKIDPRRGLSLAKKIVAENTFRTLIFCRPTTCCVCTLGVLMRCVRVLRILGRAHAARTYSGRAGAVRLGVQGAAWRARVRCGLTCACALRLARA
eukprot:3680141-Pleurochrysis_carterae.AAC.3